MPFAPDGSWGSGPWGEGSWGGGPFTPPPSIVSINAVAENVLRIQFSGPPYFSGLLDIGDASNPDLYIVTPIAGTVGYDGNATRPVSPSSVAMAADGNPNAVDLTLDRPMSPYPAQYAVTASAITIGDPATLIGGAGSVYGVFRYLQVNDPSVAVPNRDIANPNDASDIAGSVLAVLLGPCAQFALGSFQADDRGDYSFDAGIVGVKKRCLRRALTSKGAFLHLPGDYGVGFPDHVKKLGSATVQQRLASDWETQCKQEPEVVDVAVAVLTDPSYPGLVTFAAQIQTNTGGSVTATTTFDASSGRLVSIA